MNVFDQGSPPALFAAVAAGAAMKFAAVYMTFLRQKQYKYVGRVAELWVYPFKSFKGHSVQEAEVTDLGLSAQGFRDRHWTVVNADRVSVTMLNLPTMSLVEPTTDGKIVTLKAPGMQPISFPANPEVNTNNLRKITVKQDTVDAVDLGDEVSKWLSDFFKRDGLRLYFSAPSLGKRDVSNHKKNWKNPAKPGDMYAFANCSGFMMLSRPSLVALNAKLEKPVPIINFRANIIADDCEAFAEDSWAFVRIGDAKFRGLDACTRCPIVSTDQEKGERMKNEEPLLTLKSFRCREPYGPKAAFGMYHAVEVPGNIKVGDAIYAIVK